jgi:hypothetical protein
MLPPHPSASHFSCFIPHNFSTVACAMASAGMTSSDTTWRPWSLSPILSFLKRRRMKSAKEPKTVSCNPNWMRPRINSSRWVGSSPDSCVGKIHQMSTAFTQTHTNTSSSPCLFLLHLPSLPLSYDKHSLSPPHVGMVHTPCGVCEGRRDISPHFPWR